MGRIKHEKNRGLDFPCFVLMREEKQISALQNKLGRTSELSATQCSLLLKLKKTPRSIELSTWHTPLSLKIKQMRSTFKHFKTPPQ